MSLFRRLTLELRALAHGLLGRLENPELGLHRSILELEQHLRLSEQAVAMALAHEEELHSSLELLEREAQRWHGAAEQAIRLDQKDEARRALSRAKRSERQNHRLKEQLASQELETAHARKTSRELHDKLHEARHRQQILHARLRQNAARQAAHDASRALENHGIVQEIDRFGDEVDSMAHHAQAKLWLDDELEARAQEASFEEAAERERLDQEIENLARRLAQTEKPAKQPRGGGLV